jgi:hypothetical protein
MITPNVKLTMAHENTKPACEVVTVNAVWIGEIRALHP